LLISGDAVPRKLLEGRSILLVEDVSALRSELQTALEEVGAEVACADVARAVVYVERPLLWAAVSIAHRRRGNAGPCVMS
jgi:hypothetical protein